MFFLIMKKEKTKNAFFFLTVGRVVVELFSDICPKTCENFRCLCTGKQRKIKYAQINLDFNNV